MACIDIWTITYPLDPDGLSLGRDNNNVTIISLNPPSGDDYIYATKSTVCDSSDEVTPTITQPSGDLIFVAYGSDWIANNPDTATVVNINIPVTTINGVETLPISFNYEPINLSQRIGEIFIYASKGTSIFEIDKDGTTLNEFIVDETVSQIEKTSSDSVVWLGTSGGLYSLVNGVSTKNETLGNISGFGTGTNDIVFALDDNNLVIAETENNYRRLYSSSGIRRNLRLTDLPSYGCFKFNSDGTFIHGTSIDPEASRGHDFAVITKYENNIKQYRLILSDWEYEDNSREKIINAAFDSEGNCYCVTDAESSTTPIVTCDALPMGSECGGNIYYPETFSSAYSTQTLTNSNWAEYGNCSSIRLLNMEPFNTVKITAITLWGRDSGGYAIGPIVTDIASDWVSYSSGLSYDTDGWVFTCYGPGHYVTLQQTDPVNVCYRISAMRLTFEFNI